MARITVLVALALLLNSAAVFGAALPDNQTRSEMVVSSPVIQRQVADIDARSVVGQDAVVPLETRKHHSKSHKHHSKSHKHHSKSHKHHKKQSIKSGKVTFYSGSQLKNPRCPGHKNPNDNSMIAAVSANSPFKCGDKVKISHKGKHAVVTVIDRCAGCSEDWIDVTKGVFKKMAPLDKGVIHNVSMTKA